MKRIFKFYKHSFVIIPTRLTQQAIVRHVGWWSTSTDTNDDAASLAANIYSRSQKHQHGEKSSSLNFGTNVISTAGVQTSGVNTKKKKKKNKKKKKQKKKKNTACLYRQLILGGRV